VKDAARISAFLQAVSDAAEAGAVPRL